MLAPMLMDAALDAHRQWKAQLATAVETRRLESPVSTIAAEDACRFGRWLLGPGVPEAVKRSDGYDRVRTAHAQFHRAAAAVAQLAVEGRAEEAQAALSDSGAFGQASRALIDALQAWRRGR